MKTLDYIQLEEKSTNKVIKELEQLLADYQLYYTNLRGFHWNIKGRGFFQLHETYENLYNDAAEKIDEIAERILMLNGVPPHNFTEYLKISHIKETDIVDDGDKIAKLIL
ncbi:MAG: DNA starvation/stationary phase protection protein, partial [Vagococcus sp.]|nr:DNA starvation/stationary phase protection protein [Vagococcus sp.]